MKKEIKDFTTFLFSVLEKLLHLTDQSIILTPVTGTSISSSLTMIMVNQVCQSAYIYISTTDYLSFYRDL